MPCNWNVQDHTNSAYSAACKYLKSNISAIKAELLHNNALQKIHINIRVFLFAFRHDCFVLKQHDPHAASSD
jgi:hypothetical protein